MYFNTNLFEPGKAKCERRFMQNTAKLNLRFDKRKNDEFRDVQLIFGAGWGSVLLFMGNTKVMAQVNAEISAPQLGRPSEGILYMNLNIQGVSFLHESQSTSDQRYLKLSSLLKRAFRTSRCLDLESLCVAAERYVWTVRADVTVLNNDGNLYDACTIAALAALMHYRRPEVTFNDGVLRVYSEEERDPVPLLFLHYPTSVSYCAFKSTAQPVVDPVLLEENASDSVIVLSFNSYQELCTLYAAGKVPTNTRTVMQCAHNAARRCKQLVVFIRKALALDAERRTTAEAIGFLDQFNKSAPRLTYNTLMADETGENTADSSTPTVKQRDQTPEVQIQEQPKEEKPTAATPKNDNIWLPAAAPEAANKPKPDNRAGKKGKKKGKAGKAMQPKSAPHSDSEEDTKPVI